MSCHCYRNQQYRSNIKKPYDITSHIMQALGQRANIFKFNHSNDTAFWRLLLSYGPIPGSLRWPTRAQSWFCSKDAFVFLRRQASVRRCQEPNLLAADMLMGPWQIHCPYITWCWINPSEPIWTNVIRDHRSKKKWRSWSFGPYLCTSSFWTIRFTP